MSTNEQTDFRDATLCNRQIARMYMYGVPVLSMQWRVLVLYIVVHDPVLVDAEI